MCEQFAAQERRRTLDDLDLKLLADISWTRAGTLLRGNLPEAAKWARAALRGYEYLEKCGAPPVAESAGEDAAALRRWPLLAEDAGDGGGRAANP